MKTQKILLALSFLAFSGMSLQANTLLATVNGNAITTDVAGKNYTELRDELKDMILKRLIEKELAIEYAMNSDIVKSDTFKKNFDHIIKMSKSGVNPEAKSLKEALVISEKSISKEQLRSKKGLLAFDLLLDEKAKTIETDEQSLKEHYKNNFVKYNMPELYEISHIVVGTKKEADEILHKLKEAPIKAKEFHDLAQEHSLAPSKEEGGYLGQYDIAAMNDKIAQSIKTLKMGTYTQSFETEFGYEIVFLIGKTAAKNQTFEKAKVQVKTDFIQDVVIQWAVKEIAKLKESAVIKYHKI